ncbi:MAG: DUF402 domain-containing protein [Candidatus Aramenus sulfurataquae]|jgi:hypothetical protein|uniref:DUF402 domain-containing protein n=2 Tax=Candidatus Aramenus sulfurataquae TaxID=1326980 RepID=A0A0F2LNZ2_9CREN|nr:DUF402 domain-containing protein [Candidatus Aramenus sulfurataquae]
MSSSKLRVRIRGIYATALTYLAKERFQVVQQSPEIAQRFNEEIVMAPADVTIKNNDEGHLISIGQDVNDFLKEVFKASIVWKSPVKLYSVIETEDCTYMGFKVEPCMERGLVVKPPYDGKLGLDEVKAVGKYAFVWRGEGRTYFSEHVRKRDVLLKISLPFNKKGYNVKWRSNAPYADERELREELERLAMKYDNEDFKQGEDFSMVLPSLEDKLYLDEVRGKVLRTQRFHHMLKLSFSEVDEREPKDMFNELIEDFMEIEHVKLGGTIRLRGGKVIKKEVSNEGYKLWLIREISPGGLYDGLGIEKEEGDYDVMEVDSSKWYEVHNYYSKDGRLKGKYVNISTPPELLRGKIRYVDLELDVVVKDGEVKVLDEDKYLEIKRYFGEKIEKKVLSLLKEFTIVL